MQESSMPLEEGLVCKENEKLIARPHGVCCPKCEKIDCEKDCNNGGERAMKAKRRRQ